MKDENGEEWLTTQLPCSSVLKKTFIPPSKGKEEKKEKDVDMEGWHSLYDTKYHKAIEYKERNRFHTGLIKAAEEAKDTEKPELPLSNVQNALIFKRMTARRQIMGSVL